MSVSIVGKNVTDGLIFHIDTFNAKSYVGQPTTNLNNQISNYTGTSYCSSGEWTSDPTRFTKTHNSTLQTPIGTGATLCVESGTAGYHHLSSMGGGGENGLHSISCYVYPLSTITNFTIGMLNDSGNQVSFDLSTKAITYGGGIENRSAFCRDVEGYPGWIRVGANIEGRFGGWVGCVGIGTGGSYTPSSPYKSFYITGLQYEAKQAPTPYIFGTRSNTQGMVDLTNRYSVDLVGAAYDSGSSIVFNGAQIIDTNLGAQTISNVTLEAWVYDTVGSGYRSIIQVNSNSDDALYIYPTSRYLGFWPCSTSTMAVPTNQWAYVAVSYNGSQLIYCMNGTIEVVVASCSHITDFQYLRIGGISTTDGECFQGKINQASVYNRALSSDELLKNYNRTKARYGR